MENEPHVCQPLITVVTVCYNAAATIEETIQSVINQTYPYIEYLIIDGASTDGTVDIIKRYQDRIAYWVSEPDKGIYDAMNKGIEKATGEWINFMNSGDAFYAPDVLEKVAPFMTEDVDVVYGDTELKFSWGTLIKKASHLDSMCDKMPFCHQSCIIRLSNIKIRQYNLNYRICADYELLYYLYIQNKCFFRVNQVIAVYESEDGISSKMSMLMNYERAKINGNYLKCSFHIKFRLNTMYVIVSKTIQRCIPNPILLKIRKIKYHLENT